MNKHLLRKRIIGTSVLSLFAIGMSAQMSFTNANSSLHSSTGTLGSNANNRSTNGVVVVDMNADGLDDICRLSDAGLVTIEFQRPGGTFTFLSCGTFATTGPWAMAAGDVDKNGYKDVIAGYGSTLKLMKINASGSMGITTLPSSSFFVQNMNFMDVNNDGWIDIFACDDNSFAKLWLNNGSGSYPAEAANSVINFDITAGQSTGTSNDDSGNYGSVWTDFDNDGDVDLYIAKCRQSVSSGTDPRRIDVLMRNNGGSNYSSQASTYGLGSGDQDWTPAFGDIDNDGDFDLFLTKHNTTSQIYLNDGTGHFTSGATVTFGSMPMQSQFEDMDNDGFVDLVISGDNDYRVYHNNGNGTFTDVTTGITNMNGGGSNFLSFATGDLNHDGRIDIYTSYGTTYNNPSTNTDDIYWKNSTVNANHYITLVMAPTNSNNDALGARAYIYGSWGVQTREVRAGESYGTQNSGALHFGIGAATSIDSIVVNWPSGAQNVIISPAVDQFLSVGESNQCTLSNVVANPSGPTNLCTGGNVTLTAPTGSGYTYLWSNGATTSSINVTTAGSYAVQVTQSPGCMSTSPSVNVTLNANETPTISASSSVLSFCQGNSVTITSTPAASYTWSSGENTQSIIVTASGTYSVTIAGACQNWTSTAITVTVMPTPTPPTGPDVNIATVQVVTVTATGTNDTWYDAMTGGTAIGTGNNYTTTGAVGDTAFYVADKAIYGGAINGVAPKFHSGTNYSGTTTNGSELFNVLAPCTLKTVKVYTDSPGNRIVELRNSTGTVLNSLMINIPVDTSLLTLNFPLTVGNGFQLGTNTAQNNTLLGTNSPRLMRSNSTIAYPYTLGGKVSITGSDQGSTLFYYFYDWKIADPQDICENTSRTMIKVILTPTTGKNNIASANDFSVYPNPASSSFSVRLNATFDGQTSIELRDVTGRLVSVQNAESAAKHQLFSFDVRDVSKGIYFVNILNKGQKITQKLVIQ